MKKWTILWLSGLMGLAVGPHALSAESESATAAAPYLLAGAPSFDLSISQFREKFNVDNPKLPLNEFRSISTSRDRANLTRAASKINENLYASTALERGTLKNSKIVPSQMPHSHSVSRVRRSSAAPAGAGWPAVRARLRTSISTGHGNDSSAAAAT